MVGHEVREVMESHTLESLVSHYKHFGFSLSDSGEFLERFEQRSDQTLAAMMRRDWVGWPGQKQEASWRIMQCSW